MANESQKTTITTPMGDPPTSTAMEVDHHSAEQQPIDYDDVPALVRKIFTVDDWYSTPPSTQHRLVGKAPQLAAAAIEQQEEADRNAKKLEREELQTREQDANDTHAKESNKFVKYKASVSTCSDSRLAIIAEHDAKLAALEEQEQLAKENVRRQKAVLHTAALIVTKRRE